jgi:hypothetical protein
MTSRRALLGILAAVIVAAPACRKREAAVTPAAGPTPPPDLPRAFGPRCVWLAVHGATTAAVARALALGDAAPSGWEAGVKAAYAGRVFVTPPLDGWVLAASVRLPDAGGGAQHPDEATPLLARLSAALGEVQYFGSYDEIGWLAWARFRDGKALRKFAVLGAQDAVLWNEGEPTAEERALGLAPGDRGGDAGLDDRSIFALARAWSVDPSALEARHLGPSLGMTGTLAPTN